MELNKINHGNKISLLIGGKQAFPVILQEIRNCRESIYICMFVWREDRIGKQIARELLLAADRGVKIVIDKDRYGILCECSEENRNSLFHKYPVFKDIVGINIFKVLYQPGNLFKSSSKQEDELLRQMKKHPNITIRSEEYRLDHSKYFIFDEKIIIAGGINIEDKENGADVHGTEYVDYMLRIDDPDAVVKLHKAMNNEPGSGNGMFGLNIPGNEESGIARRYLELINASNRELSIIMSYMIPLKEIMSALKKALNRGVKLRLLIPEKANYLNDSNRCSAMQLYEYAKQSGGDLEIYLSGKMSHIKAMMSENTISIGSANITGKSLGRQGELNVFIDNDDSEFCRSVRESFETQFKNAAMVNDPRQLKYRKLICLMEKIAMS